MAGSMPAGAAATASPDRALDLVRAVVAKDAELASYRARVAVDVRLRSFPYVSEHLDGTAYFQRPGRYGVVFDRVPGIAKGFDALSSDIGDHASWERRFDLSVSGERQYDGHTDVVVRLVQKVRGMIDHEDVAIDPARARVDAMDWYYYNGGEISMTESYRPSGGADLPAEQHLTIRIPFVHAGVDADFSQYQTNVAIDPSVFARGDHR